jgi:hypothetical protein
MVGKPCRPWHAGRENGRLDRPVLILMAPISACRLAAQRPNAPPPHRLLRTAELNMVEPPEFTFRPGDSRPIPCSSRDAALARRQASCWTVAHGTASGAAPDCRQADHAITGWYLSALQ